MDDLYAKYTRVLLIEDNPGDVRLIQETLLDAVGIQFEFECVDRLAGGLERLTEGGIDVVLLDLSLPDSHGLETLSTLRGRAPEVPILVMTNLDDETIAIKAVRAGAQDYLVKGQTDSNLLIRSIRYAIERHRLMVALCSLSLIDELTALYNRRGFLTFTHQHLKVANRNKKGMFLVFVDLDNMKWINDNLGHREGDLALIETASILRETFRDSDIIARIGGDEFAVLAIEAQKNSADIIVSRLHQNFKTHNETGNTRFKLSASLGIAHYDPEHPSSIDSLLAEADMYMYEEKRRKKEVEAQKH